MGNLEIITPALMLIFGMGCSPAPPPVPVSLPALEQQLPVSGGGETEVPGETAKVPVKAAGPIETKVPVETVEILVEMVEVSAELKIPVEAAEASVETPEILVEAAEIPAELEIPMEAAEAPVETVKVPIEAAAPVETVEVLEMMMVPAELEIPVEAEILVETPAAENPPGPAGKSEGKRPPVLAFTAGLTGSYLTRIIRQENRSNFVFEDYLAGLFFNVKTRPLKPVNIMARLSAYYPLLFYFNDIPQPSANPIHYGADLFLGPVFEGHIKNLIRFNLSPGLHIFFENTDRWNYLHLGAAALAGIELPVTTRWTLYLDGLASLDYGSLGNNRTVEPIDIVYQYQLGLGLRYSKKAPNIRPWIKPRQKTRLR